MGPLVDLRRRGVQLYPVHRLAMTMSDSDITY